MIKIGSKIIKKQKRFWGGCVFHPTDAVEDPWGKRILDTMARDGAIERVRIYTMFEDIVYLGDGGELCFDFRLSDLRLDYLVDRGYCPTLAYAGIPDCIASSLGAKTSVSKNKTRYKGKMWNSSPPRDYALWEQICYEYTKHVVERYGIETVSTWRCHCFNEPDLSEFFLHGIGAGDEGTARRCAEYCKLYAAFERGVRRVSERIPIGGPALACNTDFLGAWLDFVKENGLKLDFVTVHYYGTTPHKLNSGEEKFCVQSLIDHHTKYAQDVAEHGFADLPIAVDEWGMASAGFYNRDECPALIAREGEVFSAYFAKLICRYIEEEINIDSLMICLSGQHEMTEDFSGFRNFFTLNFIKKPIYNAFILSSRLKDGLLLANCDADGVATVATRADNGDYAVLVSYSSENFEEDIPSVTRRICFDEDIRGKRVSVACIDGEHTNPYKLSLRLGIDEPSEEQIRLLRREGELESREVQYTDEGILLNMAPNSTYLICVNSI